MTLQLGIALALASAVATNVGFLCKHRGVCASPAVDVLRPLATARGLLSSRWFALGVAVALFAGLLHVIALALAPLSVVQAVVAAGVVLLAVMARHLFGHRVGRRQWSAVLLTGAGLGLLALTVPRATGAHSASSASVVISYSAILAGVGVALLLVRRLGPLAHARGVVIGAAAGIFFGVTDIAIKAFVGVVATDGVAGVVGPWLPLILVAGLAAQYASARGLQLGEAVSVIAVTGATATVASVAAGFVVFGDPLPHALLPLMAEAAGFVLICLAALVSPPPSAAPAPATG